MAKQPSQDVNSTNRIQSAIHEPATRFVVITPCRDEAAHLAATLESVLQQSRPPDLWIIVDDGSKDETPDILAKAACRHPFIQVVRREDRGSRQVGVGVIDAFYAGLKTVPLEQFAYLCKLDGDLELPVHYFERILAKMQADPCLGTLSGKVYLRSTSGRLTHERRGDENSVGPAKFYRTACFKEIGGFARMLGWDGVDGHCCRLSGWIARSVDDPELRIVHRRQMGSSDRSVYHGRIRAGMGRWYIGSSLPFVLATTLYRAFDRPYVLGSLLTLYGYARAMLRREPRFGDLAYRRYLRAYESDVLFRGKRHALQLRDAEIRSARANGQDGSSEPRDPAAP